MQRHDARRQPRPDRLRARHERALAREARRLEGAARLPLRGQVPEQPQRRLRALRRVDLLLRPVVRALPGLRHRARARAGLAGRLPDPARRRPGRHRARRRPERVRDAERRLLLAGRVARLHQRHAAGSHQGVRRERGRHVLERPHVLRGSRLGRDRGGDPGRDEVRRARQHLGDRAWRRLGHLARSRAPRRDQRPGEHRQPVAGAATTGTPCSSRARRPCTRSAPRSARVTSPTCPERRRRWTRSTRRLRP